MLKVKNIQQLNATYVVELNSGEFFEFDLVFDTTKVEWALIGENRYYGMQSRYSEAETKVVLKILKELNARDVNKQPKKAVKKAVKKTVKSKK